MGVDGVWGGGGGGGGVDFNFTSCFFENWLQTRSGCVGTHLAPVSFAGLCDDLRWCLLR